MVDKDLLLAAKNGDLVEVTRLLKIGRRDYSPVYIVSPRIDTALTVAVKNGHNDIARLLIKTFEDSYQTMDAGSNAFLSFINKIIIAPIHNIIANDKCYKYINHKDSYGRGALFYALANNNLEMAEFLIQKGANVNATASGEWSMLSFFVLHQKSDVVKMLISKGANVNSQDGKGNPLILAVMKGDHEIIDLLLAHNANVNARDISGRTAVMIAANNGDVKTINSLLKDPMIRINITDFTRSRKTAFDYAYRPDDSFCRSRKGIVERMETIELLLRNGANATERGLVPRESNLHYQHYPEAERQLLLAAADGNVGELLKLIDMWGADFIQYKSDAHGVYKPNIFRYRSAAFYLAAKNGHLAAVIMLIPRNTLEGFICAAANGHMHIVEYILNQTAHVNINDYVNVKDSNTRRSVLSYAAGNGHLDIVKLLLTRGAVTDFDALEQATNNNHSEICIVLAIALKMSALELYYGNLAPDHMGFFELRRVEFIHRIIKFTLDYAWTKPDKTDFETLMVILFPNANGDLKSFDEEVVRMVTPYFKLAAGLLLEYQDAHYKMLTDSSELIPNGLLPLGTLSYAFSNARTLKHADGTEEVIPHLPGVIQSKILSFLPGFGKAAQEAAIQKLKQEQEQKQQHVTRTAPATA